MLLDQGFMALLFSHQDGDTIVGLGDEQWAPLGLNADQAAAAHAIGEEDYFHLRIAFDLGQGLGDFGTEIVGTIMQAHFQPADGGRVGSQAF
jgi:hypothetical protein